MSATMKEITRLLNEKSTSFWLRNALESALKRDPVDAVADAEVLARVLNSRADEIIGSSGEELGRALPSPQGLTQ